MKTLLLAFFLPYRSPKKPEIMVKIELDTVSTNAYKPTSTYEKPTYLR